MEIGGVFGSDCPPLNRQGSEGIFAAGMSEVSVVEVRQKIQHKRIATAKRVGLGGCDDLECRPRTSSALLLPTRAP